MSKQILIAISLVIFFIAGVGCKKTAPAKFRLNKVEWLKLERLHLSDGESFDSGYEQEIGNILTAIFGTPDEPRFPYLLGESDPAHDVISLANLKMSAGPVPANRDGASGLFREHCARCHGLTGDGTGPSAISLNPYPRDYRLGKFKFKSTPLRSAPTDADLKKVLKHGIPGSAMPSFRELPEQQIDALIDYVKYLSIRGQFERFLIAEMAGQDGEPLIDLKLKKTGNQDDANEFTDQLYGLIGDGLQEGIIKRWLDPEKKVTEVLAAPESFDRQHPEHGNLVAQGRDLFLGKGNCKQCHGETGMGDGQADNFDDWTSEWIKSARVDPFKESTFQDFLAAGALPPRPIRPRNLHEGILRGGDQPGDLYVRLHNGIEGTPMPASTALDSQEIWALVAYIQSLWGE